jgi:hypothetical protein
VDALAALWGGRPAERPAGAARTVAELEMHRDDAETILMDLGSNRRLATNIIRSGGKLRSKAVC